ncbi:MAG: hypothetical protein GY804_11700 [Alphaproteobacteria bacterium]|nr:hypothetical protein [Alphaproteobacteria bacterium]
MNTIENFTGRKFKDAHGWLYMVTGEEKQVYYDTYYIVKREADQKTFPRKLDVIAKWVTDFETPQQGLSVTVYKFPHGDRTKNGLSASTDSICIVNVGIHQSNANDNNPAFVLTENKTKTGIRLEPLAPMPLDRDGWMFGSNLANSSDGRFPYNHPVKIYDRCE